MAKKNRKLRILCKGADIFGQFEHKPADRNRKPRRFRLNHILHKGIKRLRLLGAADASRKDKLILPDKVFHWCFRNRHPFDLSVRQLFLCSLNDGRLHNVQFHYLRQCNLHSTHPHWNRYRYKSGRLLENTGTLSRTSAALLKSTLH